MRVRNKFLIVLFSVLLFHSIIAQITTEQSSLEPTNATATDETTANITATSQLTTTNPLTEPITITSCKYPDEFPLFSNDVCISRIAYTAIFLTSIILAGISFLMLIGLLILCCIRSSRSSGSSYGDNELSNSSDSVGKKNNLAEMAPVNRRGGQHTTGLQNGVTGTTSLEDKPSRLPHQVPFNNHHRIEDEPLPRSIPYTTTQPVPKQKPDNQDSIESHEMVVRTRETTKSPATAPRTQPLSTPKTAPKQDGRSGKSRTNTVLPNPDTETSYF